MARYLDFAALLAIAAVAQVREGTFGREAAQNVRLREARGRARRAADGGDAVALTRTTRDVYSHVSAIFFLATVRHIGVTRQDVARDKDHGTHRVEALALYQTIQPDVATADPSADETIMAYLEAEASGITQASRDAALAALNGVASELLLTQDDSVTSYYGPDNAPD